MRTLFTTLIVGGALTLSAAAALGQQAEGEKVVFKKRTIIDFSDVLIEGDLTRPEGSYLVSRKQSSFSKLIKVRESFVPELLASPNQL